MEEGVFEHRFERNERRASVGVWRELSWQRHLRGRRPCEGGCWLCSQDSREARVAGAEEAEVCGWRGNGKQMCGALAAHVGVWILHLRKMGATVGFWAEEQHRRTWVFEWIVLAAALRYIKVGIPVSGSRETRRAFSWANGIAMEVVSSGWILDVFWM